MAAIGSSSDALSPESEGADSSFSMAAIGSSSDALPLPEPSAAPAAQSYDPSDEMRDRRVRAGHKIVCTSICGMADGIRFHCYGHPGARASIMCMA